MRLRKIVREGLQMVSNDLIAKYFEKSKDYERAYSEGYTTENVDSIVKIYKIT